MSASSAALRGASASADVPRRGRGLEIGVGMHRKAVPL